MANNTGKRGTSAKNTRTTSTRKTNTNSKNKKNTRTISDEDLLIINYAVIIGSVCLCILLFLCNFKMVGSFGDIVSGIMFGLFGKMAYVFPVILILFGIFVDIKAD